MGVDNYQKLTTGENTLLGIVAGTIEVSILQPMLYLKNASQQGLPFTLDPRKLYRGLAISITNMSVLTGLQFPLTGLATSVITGGENRKLSPSEQILSGFGGGAISGIACAPMELVLIQQQRFGGTILNTPTRIIHNFGFWTLFRGLTTSCGREGMFTAGYMGIGPSIRTILEEEHGLAPTNAKIFGAIGGGVIAATLSHPMDTIKSCMQGDIEQRVYTSFRGTTSMLHQGGLNQFFRGWGWRTGRMICAVFIMSECKVRLAPLLFPHHFA